MKGATVGDIVSVKKDKKMISIEFQAPKGSILGNPILNMPIHIGIKIAKEIKRLTDEL